MGRRRKGAEDTCPSLHKSTHRLARSFCRPFGARPFFSHNLGLKPQAESSRPFGTMTSSSTPSYHVFSPSLFRLAVSPHRLIAVQSPNEHNTHIAKLRPAFTQEAFPSRFRLREMLPNFCRMIRSYAVLQ